MYLNTYLVYIQKQLRTIKITFNNQHTTLFRNENDYLEDPFDVLHNCMS